MKNVPQFWLKVVCVPGVVIAHLQSQLMNFEPTADLISTEDRQLLCHLVDVDIRSCASGETTGFDLTLVRIDRSMLCLSQRCLLDIRAK